MKTKIIEASNGFNWGKFMVARFDKELVRASVFEKVPLLLACGWDPLQHLLVVDLQTGEGAIFRHGGFAEADLEKHRVWVCPLFQPFLEWFYQQDISDLDALPDAVMLPEAPTALLGYRREGPGSVI